MIDPVTPDAGNIRLATLRRSVGKGMTLLRSVANRIGLGEDYFPFIESITS
jgi:hypothetical protein